VLLLLLQLHLLQRFLLLLQYTREMYQLLVRHQASTTVAQMHGWESTACAHNPGL
jgi:hypothetical protein